MRQPYPASGGISFAVASGALTGGASAGNCPGPVARHGSLSARTAARQQRPDMPPSPPVTNFQPQLFARHSTMLSASSSMTCQVADLVAGQERRSFCFARTGAGNCGPGLPQTLDVHHPPHGAGSFGSRARLQAAMVWVNRAPTRFTPPPKHGLRHRPDRPGPTGRLLDHLAALVQEGVAGVSGGAAVDRPIADPLRHMGCDAGLPQIVDDGRAVVVLVGTRRRPPGRTGRRAVDHGEGGPAFGMATGVRHPGSDDQPVPVRRVFRTSGGTRLTHKPMAHEAEACAGAGRLPVKPRLADP